MKLILNTAVSPHFCLLFDEKDNIIESISWLNFRKDGLEVFDFFTKNKSSIDKIKFLGIVSGPGGFSSLRAGVGIINALSFSLKLPVHQIRADKWISNALTMVYGEDYNDKFVLNSFSNTVFVYENKKLIRKDLEEVVKTYSEKEFFVELLPPEKQSFFKKRLTIPLDILQSTLLDTLNSQPEQKNAIPDYEFAPV